MANERDCENCKHHKEVCKNGIFYHSCESWDCEFEPKEDEEFEPKGDLISREAVLKIIDGWYEKNRDTDNIEDLIVLITYMDSVNPQEPCEPVRNPDKLDCVSRQAVLDTLENMDRALDEDRTVESYKELLRECYKVLPSVSSSKKPRLIDPAYEKTLNKWIGAEVLDRIRNEMHATAEKHEDGVYYLRDEWVDEIIDKYAEEDKA